MENASPEWHFTDIQDQDIGPLSVVELRQALQNKKLDSESYVWHPDHVSEWTPLKDLPELEKILRPPPPPPQVAPKPAVAPPPPPAPRPKSIQQAAPAPSSSSNAGAVAAAAAAMANRPAIAPRPGASTKPEVASRPAAAAAAAVANEKPLLVKSESVRAAAAASAKRRNSGQISQEDVQKVEMISKKPAAPAPMAASSALKGAVKDTIKKGRIGHLGGQRVGDWVEHTTADQVNYYHNVSTGELTWDKPDAMKAHAELAGEQGEWVWIPDERMGYVPGKLLSKNPDGGMEVALENGEKKSLKRSANVYPLMKSSLSKTEQDLVLLDNLDEGLILYNLRKRFEDKRQIYTNIGNILISINPYETYAIYGIEKIYEYRQRGNRVLDPHVFIVADEALVPLMEYGENHSILISGESGAGKTWNTKQCLSYLTEVTSQNAGGKANIESRILAANPILEGFGNAKTVRNDNSSRFGRFTEIHFEKKDKKIQGARIDNFLLEKSRVVWQQDEERNYHVFYQLAKTPAWASKFGIKSVKDFNYLNKSGCFEVDGVDDAADFQAMLQAFDEMGMSKEEQEWVLELVAGVLHIGNITFVSDGGEGSKLGSKSQDAMSWVSKLLYVSSEEIMNGFTHRSIEVRGETTKIPLKPDDAASSRDALAKSIYGQLFDWLISRVNVALNGQPRPWALIGLLDIFGFEIFKVNSFEQLCINFTNEKLQQLFNRDTFEREQQTYRNEGVPFDEIKHIDNQPILDMIEKPPVGLLFMLDDMNRMPKSTDEGFVLKADSNHGSNKHYGTASMTRQGNRCFTVRHYAGDVVYDADGFLVKNKDLLFADLYDAMSRSTRRETASMFPPLTANERSKYSLGAQFRQQLSRLMDVLNTTQTHYIRCVKPNSFKAARELEPNLTLEQLRYSGVFEAVRIRKQGYPFRYTFSRFVDRYKCLMLRDAKWVPLKATDPRAQVKEILQTTGQDFKDLQLGATMCLYRAHTHRLLELLRALSLEKVCALIQAMVRGSIARTFVRRTQAVIPRLEAAVKSRDLDMLDKALADYSRVVGEYATMVPCDLTVTRKAKRIRFALMEWEKLATEMESITQNRDVSTDDDAFEALRVVVWKADDVLDEPGGEWHMQMYQYSLELFESERFARLDPRLTECMNLLEADLMSEVYAECERLKFKDPRLQDIEKFMRLGKDELLKYQYKKAKELKMTDRAREKEIKIREMFLDAHADMFPFERYSHLRAPEEFASASFAFWKREELAASMMRWTATPIKTSLTQLDPLLSKIAVKLHKAILGFCGERANPTPDSLAHELTTNGIETKELRDEIYCQILKHLSGNDEHPQSKARAWKLLALCLHCFPPSTDFENYMHIFIRRNGLGDQKEKLRDLLYEREYAGVKTPTPSIQEVTSLLFKC